MAISIPEGFGRNVGLIAYKEILYGSRDPDVLIYGLLLPLILYPIMFIGSGEFAFWLLGQFEKRIATIGVTYTPDLRYEVVKHSLQEVKNFKVVDSTDPQSDLKSHRVDAVVIFDQEKKHRVFIKLPGANLIDKTSLLAMASILSEQEKRIDQAAKDAGITKSDRQIFTTKTIDVAPSTSQQKVVPLEELRGIPVAILACVLLVWVHVALCAGPPAAVMFAEEREKKTLETTLLLPPTRMVVVLGKFLATKLIALGSGSMYLVGFGITFLALEFSVHARTGKGSIMASMMPQVVVSPESWVMLAVTILLSSAVCAAVYLASTVKASTFKEAQAYITVPVLFFSFIPFMVLVPGIELDIWTALVPVLNLFLTLKRGEPHLLYTSIAVISMLGIIIGCLYFCAHSLNVKASQNLG